ncbi:hypothetical protein FQR65_LT16726 [Abscondita terminalis]|nr:hypothetical protein FQR65_LT16726 [Abscondita terminalis]
MKSGLRYEGIELLQVTLDRSLSVQNEIDFHEACLNRYYVNIIWRGIKSIQIDFLKSSLNLDMQPTGIWLTHSGLLDARPDGLQLKCFLSLNDVKMAQKHVLKVSSLNAYFKDELKLVEKGENAMESGHVLNMVYDATLRVVKGSVHASMKDKIYKVEIFLDEDNTISHSTCTCPRGQLSCHHVAALGLFAHYNLCVTDQACSCSLNKHLFRTDRNTRVVKDTIATEYYFMQDRNRGQNQPFVFACISRKLFGSFCGC